MNIVITGASKGMGKAMAEKFSAAGNKLFICARNEQELALAAKEISEKYNNLVAYLAVDLSKKDQVLEFANWILKQNTPDVLINNAGQFVPGSIYNEPDGNLEQMIEINLYGTYNLTRALLPAMMKNQSGHIFNISSIAGLKAYSNGGSYSISKYAVRGFSKNLREEMKAFNIKVTTVYSGAVFTDSWAGAGIKPDRIMEVGDIANMVYTASLLSPQACVEDIVIRPQLGDLP